MEHNWFFPPHEGIRLSDLADQIGATLEDNSAADRLVRSVAPVYRAEEGDICYMLSRKQPRRARDLSGDRDRLRQGARGARSSPYSRASDARSPIRPLRLAGALLHPGCDASRRAICHGMRGISPAAVVDPTAQLEDDVDVEPMAVIGAGAEIGAGTRIGAGAMIGPGVRIGRDCTIAAGASVLCALVGNNVIIHPGARIGQDGFGYAPGPKGGMIKIVQIGRVIIQDNVEIGANTTIDRGTMDDTVIGEGTKIDNQVQIGHNVQIGRHCGIVGAGRHRRQHADRRRRHDRRRSGDQRPYHDRRRRPDRRHERCRLGYSGRRTLWRHTGPADARLPARYRARSTARAHNRQKKSGGNDE